jgi:hypothetical protein
LDDGLKAIKGIFTSSQQGLFIVYGEINQYLAFSESHIAIPVLSYTLSHPKSIPKYSSVWSIHCKMSLAEKNT